MPPERATPGSPADWMARAHSDLALARAPLPEGAFYEDLCFHAQQAAEKAIKAVYRAHSLAFRYTHDLQDLLDGLKQKPVSVPREVEAASDLTGFAWETRYPGLAEPVTPDEYHAALLHAETVVAWAESAVSLRRSEQEPL